MLVKIPSDGQPDHTLMELIINGSDGVFRDTFVVAGVLAVLVLVASLYVHDNFMELGGSKGHMAPE